MSINWHSDVEPKPRILVLPPDAASLDEAHAAIELWEFYARKRLDPAQRLTVEVMMATRADGRWAAETTGREMPRQNGKGDEIEVVELWGLVQRSEAILHTVHDAVLLATQAHQRMLGVLEGHPDLRKRIETVWRGTGQQMIQMSGGGVVWYRTRTAGGGRGVDNVDRLVVDEAQHATEDHIAAASPTLLANPNPQLNALGSGGIAGKSQWWWRLRRRALAANPGRFGYVGHTAERLDLNAEGKVVSGAVDVEDRELWRLANPSIGAGRGGGMEFLEEQLLRLGPAAFAREHLGVWDPDLDGAASSVWPAGVWEAANVATVERPTDGVAFAVDVNPERNRAAIAVGSPGGSCGLVAERAGVGWVIDELAGIAARTAAPVVLAGRGPAGSLVADLERAGVKVVALSQADVAVACGWMFDAVAERRVVVQRDPALDASVKVAVQRPTGGDAWVWDRRSGDVHALVALTFAVWRAGLPAEARRPVFVF